MQFIPFEILQEEAVKYNFDGARIVCFNTKKDKKYVLKSDQNFNEAERIQKYLGLYISNFPMLFTTTFRIVQDHVFPCAQNFKSFKKSAFSSIAFYSNEKSTTVMNCF